MEDDSVLAVLAAYPQIYHACHFRHPSARTSKHGISTRDAWILGHLDLEKPVSPKTLATHMGLRASTVSEAIARLEKLGYITRRKADGDARRIELRLSEKGADAMRGTSVLDAGRVAELLEELAPPLRARAIAGIGLLAEAARSLNRKSPKQWSADEHA
jgi:MarR family transcriptional regulator, organic hydroperoxide resistance regulator